MTGTKQLQFHRPWSIYVYLTTLTKSKAITDGWPAREAEEAAI
jgi:hypothetical protein